ncbi:MAG: transposase [Blastocatellia bacterium]
MPSITPVNHVIFRIVQAPQACLIFLSHIFLSDRQPTLDRKMWDRKMLIVYSLLPLVGLRPTLESGAQERVGSLVKTRKIRGNDDREVINGILYVLTTGCGWEYLPL